MNAPSPLFLVGVSLSLFLDNIFFETTILVAGEFRPGNEPPLSGVYANFDHVICWDRQTMKQDLQISRFGHPRRGPKSNQHDKGSLRKDKAKSYPFRVLQESPKRITNSERTLRHLETSSMLRARASRLARPRLWRPTRITWREPPPGQPTSVARQMCAADLDTMRQARA